MSEPASLLLPALPWVSAQWLASNLGSPELRVLDATYSMPGTEPSALALFEAGHISGAMHWDIDAIADLSVNLPHMMPSPERFAQAASALGLRPEHTIIISDARGLFSAARLWFTFRAFGHEQVRVLDGGTPTWQSAGFALQTGPAPAPPPPSAPYPIPSPPAHIYSRSQVERASETGYPKIIDARSRGRFAGQDPEPWPGRRTGHIPNSLNLPYAELLAPQTGLLLPLQALRQAIEKAGVDPTQPTIVTCGSGVTACVLALVLHALGHPNAILYDGSWAEWGLSLHAESGPPIRHED